MARETNSTQHCLDCNMEITYSGLEAPKEPRCSKCQRALDKSQGTKKGKKAEK